MPVDEFVESRASDLSPEQMERIQNAIGLAVANALRTNMPLQRRHKQNTLGIVGICLTAIALCGTLIGAWIVQSNRLERHQAQIDNTMQDVNKLGVRVDSLEKSSQTVTNAATQITDLKDSFDQFRITYREDFRDLKQQVQAQQESRNRGR